MILIPIESKQDGDKIISTYKYGDSRQRELCYVIEGAFPDVRRVGMVVNGSTKIQSIEEFSEELTEASYRLQQGFAIAFIHITTNPNIVKISSKSDVLNDEIKQTIMETRCPDKYKRPPLN